jgi:23S rRNA pseudouridine1911/1915/1917 synthase
MRKKIIVIQKEEPSKRLDKFLQREIFCNEKISRADIIREIKSGKILVNGKIVKPSYVLKESDELNVVKGEREKEAGLFPNSKIKIKVLEDNANFLVIDKPAGIQVHPDAHEKENTIANWLLANYPKIKDVHDGSRDAQLRPGIVHRLDKDTSGLMVIAKNQKTFNTLKKLFQDRKVKKTYLAIVHGILKEKTGTIETEIAKSADYKRQTIATVRTRTKARSAFTGYSVLKEFKDYSLVEAYLKTGRTHQIRIHLWSIGHPVVGDQLYKRKAKSNLAGRQMLHAEKLSFMLGSKAYSFRSNPPADFKNFIKLAK